MFVKEKTIIINDFHEANSLKKGYPDGHVALFRFLTVPVFSQNKIMAVVGVANKDEIYDETDARQLSVMMDSVWKYAERKQSEEALLESEEKFSVAFRSSPYAILITNIEDGKIIDFNSGFTEMTGYTYNDVAGKSTIELNLWYSPEERNQFIENIKTTKKIFNKEIRFRKKNNDIIICLFSSEVVNIKNINYLHTSINDITERKQNELMLAESEKMFSAMFYKSPVIIIITTPYEGRFIEVNKTFLKTMEYTSEEVIGHTTEELGIFVDLNDRYDLLEILKTKNHVFGFECDFKTKNGKIMTGLLSIIFIQYKGELCQFSTVIDISSRKKAELSLQESESKYRNLVENALIGVYRTRLDGKNGLCKRGNFKNVRSKSFGY